VHSAIDDLITAARLHEASFQGVPPILPRRHLAIVTCMDARIDLQRIFGLEAGDAHVMRNAGGLVTEDVLRSLVLSQRLLQTREIIVMHHTQCGLHGADEPALRAQIAAETGEPPPYAFGAFDDIDDAVRDAVARIRADAFLPHRDNVRGFVYDVATGNLREV